MRQSVRWSWILSIVLFSLTGCSTQIPQGHIGKVLSPSGWKEEVHESGYASTLGRDQLYLAEVTETSHTEKISVLCADKLNFKCETVIVSRPKTDSVSRQAIFQRVKAEKKDGVEQPVITAEKIYETYVRPIVVPAVYNVVGRRQTDQITGTEMALIQQEVLTACKSRLAESPVEIMVIDFVNTDYPDSVTQANEARKTMEVQALMAKAQADADVARAEGKLRTANKDYQVQLLEAKMIADCNRIIGASLAENPLFLMWHQIKVYGAAANGPNNAFLVPYEAFGGGSGAFGSEYMRQAMTKAQTQKAPRTPELAAAEDRLTEAQRAAAAAEQNRLTEQKTESKLQASPAPTATGAPAAKK